MMMLNAQPQRRIIVEKSFYMTFDGKRCYCQIPDLQIDGKSMTMRVQYTDNDQEAYDLTSRDAIHYSGAYSGAADDSRVEFIKYQHANTIVLSGIWKCGGREGEWYIEGRLEKERMPNVLPLASD